MGCAVGSTEGQLKGIATRTGLGVNEYLDRLSKGLLYCWRCQDWHQAEEFGKDSSRASGRTSSCRRSKNADARQRHEPVQGPRPVGRIRVQPRDGDYRQARRRVNYLVDQGLIPDPNDLPCTDCAHIYAVGGWRHEYDHHLGYAAEHHEDVQAVCTSCHRAREGLRRAAL